ncbi:uncharacterized protein LY89DRAFT_714284 [Mollisia scopiformis]|uniref:Uncharacterized protein n=1 Tax=Mollisia scopiformis TaxID=149040 RepID=A0A194XRZ5_MOLSC|nr:uncharacterized protein LY89DRAFT_714284 [Mollisia scopiformis]KUJ22497.1 hypothetical protein LY89DRAFT_714284 [Mollisia scopiformis]
MGEGSRNRDDTPHSRTLCAGNEGTLDPGRQKEEKEKRIAKRFRTGEAQEGAGSMVSHADCRLQAESGNGRSRLAGMNAREKDWKKRREGVEWSGVANHGTIQSISSSCRRRVKKGKAANADLISEGFSIIESQVPTLIFTHSLTLGILSAFALNSSSPRNLNFPAAERTAVVIFHATSKKISASLSLLKQPATPITHQSAPPSCTSHGPVRLISSRSPCLSVRWINRGPVLSRFWYNEYTRRIIPVIPTTTDTHEPALYDTKKKIQPSHPAPRFLLVVRGYVLVSHLHIVYDVVRRPKYRNYVRVLVVFSSISTAPTSFG